jgi:anti-sigma factor RsiW
MTANDRRPTAAALQQLVISTEPWLSCEDCFELLDRYVEARLADPSTAAHAMDEHLAACPACAEEAASLTVLVAHDDDIDPGPALRQMRSNAR